MVAKKKKRRPPGRPRLPEDTVVYRQGPEGGPFVKCPDEYKDMARSDGYVMLARLIVAKRLRRPLRPNERVAYVDGDKNNVDPDNLVLHRTEPGSKRPGRRRKAPARA